MAESGGQTVSGSPEWLPPGWVEQHKVLRSGREVRCYLNVDTMQKFFSKEDVIHFVSKESCSLRNSQPNNELVTSYELEKQFDAKNTDSIEESPGWLPNGWITELKIRMSGRRIGSKYNIYVDPSTGHRFHSKPEVLRHLKTIKSNACSIHEETGSGMQPGRNQHDVNTPTGCITEPHSKEGTIQCLDIVNSTKSLLDQKNGIPSLSACNVMACMHDKEGLPPGWIKETRARKKGSTIKSDPFYVDPVSGYMFRSRKDVFRYLETGDIKSCKIKPQRKDVSDPAFSEGQTSPLSGNGQVLLEAVPKAELLADNKVSDASCIASPKCGSSKKRPTEHMSAGSTLYLGAKVESPQKKALLEIANGTCGKSNIIDDSSALALSNSEASAKNGSMGVNKSKRQGANNFPRRASKRLAGLEPELVAGSDEQALSATRQTSKIKANKLEQSALNISEDFGSKQPFSEPEVKLLHHASDADAPFSGQPILYKSFSLEGQLTNEMQERETNDIDACKPIPKLNNGFSNSSGPFLELPVETTGSEIPKGVTASEQPSSVLITDIQQERSKVGKKEKNRTERTSIRLSNAKSREPKLPSQSSKRLSGSQLYEEVNLHGELATQLVSRNSIKNGAHLDASSIQNVNANMTSQIPKASSGMRLADQGFIGVKGVSTESLNWCFESPALSSVQRQEVEALNSHDKVESGLNPKLGDSWTDPCLDFAIKTLTGAIPVPNTTNPGLVSSPATDIIEQSLVDSRTKESNKVESNKFSNKNKLAFSEEVAKVGSGEVDSSGSAEYPFIASSGAFKLDTGLFHDNAFDRALPKFEAAPPTVLADQAFSHVNVPLRPEATDNTLINERQKSFDRVLPKYGAPPTVLADQALPHVNIPSRPELDNTLNNGRQSLFDRSLPKFGAAPTVLADQASSHNYIHMWPEEASLNTVNLERQSAPGPGEELQRQESVRMSLENLDSQFFLPFGEPWYDPCMEFAFKTLTGAIPVDDNLAVQDYLSQDHLGTMQPQRDCGPLPDINLPSVPQNEIPTHFGTIDDNVFREQQSLQTPMYTPANVGSSSQHTWQEANNGNLKFFK